MSLTVSGTVSLTVSLSVMSLIVSLTVNQTSPTSGTLDAELNYQFIDNFTLVFNGHWPFYLTSFT